MSFNPLMQPCTPGPVCRPAPVPRMPNRSALQRLADVLEVQVLFPLRAWRARERLRAEMEGLDERSLKDLGLIRNQIPQFVAGWCPGQWRAR